MTTRSPARPVPAGWPVLERSILSSVLGLPGYAAIAIAFGFTGLGVFIDLNRIDGLGMVFKGCYFAGCVLAACWVKRRALFGPLVQPPLLLAVAVPGVVLLTSGGPGDGGGLANNLLNIGAPLLNGFPTMATATTFTLAIGIGRYLMQRPDPVAPPPRVRRSPPPSDADPRDPASRRAANRSTQGSPGGHSRAASAPERSSGRRRA
ncbi:DUF6542 domain-containing protein [Pseudonocardia spinosispora]|uniref:DUF6542 domain-containing protein n=1 Tax=Pseudonocardia spinosispora TaxID=103441 RepID=UPI0004136ACC|nr:DUF6542 domain-containing protein [Pseudonocardia spinosispora]